MNTPSNPKAFFCLLTLDATERILDAVRINKQEKLVFGSSDQECDVVLPASPHPRFLSIPSGTSGLPYTRSVAMKSSSTHTARA
jgi:hypothetical protein